MGSEVVGGRSLGPSFPNPWSRIPAGWNLPRLGTLTNERCAVTADLETRMVTFVEAVMSAMGLSVTVKCTPIEDGTRITLDGDEGERLLRRKGAGLDALQHIVNAVFRSEHTKGHIAVDCLDYRKGKDNELRQMALLLAQRAATTGETQEIGPLNPYARRIVHLAVAEDPTVSSESIGDAFLKTVLISANEPGRGRADR